MRVARLELGVKQWLKNKVYYCKRFFYENSVGIIDNFNNELIWINTFTGNNYEVKVNKSD